MPASLIVAAIAVWTVDWRPLHEWLAERSAPVDGATTGVVDDADTSAEFEQPPGTVVDVSPEDLPEQTEPPVIAAEYGESPQPGNASNEYPAEGVTTVERVAGSRDSKQRRKPARLTDEQIAEVDALIEEGKDLAAHEILSQWYWKNAADRPRFQKRLNKLATAIYFTPQPHYEDPHVVQFGDQLRKIAKSYRLSWQYLARLNRVNPTRIRPRQKLKVVKGPFSAVIDLGDHELTVLCHGRFVRRYPVGIGKDGTTPLGKFAVEKKLENPTYYGPEGVIDGDDPDNPLGERWIDIGDSYGIHGTIDRDSIGKNESRGCIRMRAEDVEAAYDLLTVGSTVWIRR